MIDVTAFHGRRLLYTHSLFKWFGENVLMSLLRFVVPGVTKGLAKALPVSCSGRFVVAEKQAKGGLSAAMCFGRHAAIALTGIEAWEEQ